MTQQSEKSDSGKELVTLGDALPKEIERVTGLLAHYAAIGPAGMFGSAILRQSIKAAVQAQASDDIIAMIRALEDLKGCK